MFGPKEKVSAASYITSSLFAHGTLIAALAVTQIPQMIPEGTSSTTIEFSTLEAPQGEQLVAAIENPGPVIEEPVQELPQPEPKKEVKKESSPEPKPEEPKQAEPQALADSVDVADTGLPTELPNKSEDKKTETAEEPPLVEKTVEVVEEEKPEPQEEPAPASVAGLEKVEEEKEEDLVEELSEEAPVAASLPAEEDPNLEDITDEEPLEEAKVADTKKEETTAKSEAPKTAEKPAEGAAYGIPAGVRDVTEMRQVPGNPSPKYPQSARLKKQEGQIELLYFVTPQGQVKNVRVVQSSGVPALDHEAITAIKRYRFFPGQQGYTRHKVNFRLTGESKALPGRLRRSTRRHQTTQPSI